MRTIWKYPVEMAAEFKVAMPRNAEVLTVQMQGVQPCMWALVDTDEPVMDETFCIVGTGHDAGDEEAVYVGTFQTSQFVWHLFRRCP